MIADARSLRDQLAEHASTSRRSTSGSISTPTTTRRSGASTWRSSHRTGRSPPRSGEAFDAEAAARERLPADTRGLVIILAEIGRGGLNQAVIGIEEARGKLDAAARAARLEPDRRGQLRAPAPTCRDVHCPQRSIGARAAPPSRERYVARAAACRYRSAMGRQGRRPRRPDRRRARLRGPARRARPADRRRAARPRRVR